MRKSTIEKMEEHISKVTEVPKDIKKQYRKRIFINLIFCIIFILYITAIFIGKNMLQEETFFKCYKIASIFTLIISITLFELAYKKDSGYIALYGIEAFVIALFTLFSKDILKYGIPNWTKFSVLYICTYYTIKTLIIRKREKNIYLRQNNDLLEITKKESKDKLKPIMEKINEENNKKEKNKNKPQKEKSKTTKSKTTKKETNKKKQEPKKTTKTNKKTK